MSDVPPPADADDPATERFAFLRRGIGPATVGIEIGPYLNPVAAKRDGYATLVVDRYDEATLRARAIERGASHAEADRIEPVDFVGDGSRLLELVRGRGFAGQVDWIVSCHNFEHLPDPLGFLRDCEVLLGPGGTLAMIIPDKRCCFDRHQPAATLAGIVEAAESVPRPEAESWAAFRQACTRGVLDVDGHRRLAWRLADGVPERILLGDPRTPHQRLRRELSRGVAREFFGHRWRFTPALFEAILLDLHILGLVGLAVVETAATTDGEFAVRLGRAPRTEISADEIGRRRTELYLRAEDEVAVVSRAFRRVSAELADARRALDRLSRDAGTPP